MFFTPNRDLTGEYETHIVEIYRTKEQAYGHCC